MNSPTLSVCVPVYNEAENIPLLYEAIIASVEPAESLGGDYFCRRRQRG